MALYMKPLERILQKGIEYVSANYACVLSMDGLSYINPKLCCKELTKILTLRTSLNA